MSTGSRAGLEFDLDLTVSVLTKSLTKTTARLCTCTELEEFLPLRDYHLHHRHHSDAGVNDETDLKQTNKKLHSFDVWK